ncbi:MAG TPA: hypothetical protein GXX75_07785 [Clostridiales bacterium]|nr:hypothetical protein [Clostridiales bacterium]
MELQPGKGRMVFIILQVMMYAAFLVLDLTGGNAAISSYIKFAIIILCFCYALPAKRSAGKGILFLMKTALFFTVVSDLLILILDYYFYGVLTFLVVQQAYGMRISMEKHFLRQEDKRRSCLGNLFRGFLPRLLLQTAAAGTVCGILAYSGIELEPLLVASIFYFINIVMNTFGAVRAAVLFPGRRSLVMFAAGLVMFLLCDVNVGLFNLSGFISMPPGIDSTIYGMSSILMWTFYAPSQVLIALSVKAGNQ